MTGLFRDVAPGIDVSVRSNGTEDYLFLLNFSGKEACVTFEGKYVIIRICQQLYFSDTLFS